MFDEFLLAVDDATSTRVASTSLPGRALMERQHLRAWVLAHPEGLGTEVAVVTSAESRV